MDATALLRAFESFGFPNVTPRAFAAARAALVRGLIIARSFSAKRREQMQDERIDVRAKLGDHEGYAVGHQAADEMNVPA